MRMNTFLITKTTYYFVDDGFQFDDNDSYLYDGGQNFEDDDHHFDDEGVQFINDSLEPSDKVTKNGHINLDYHDEDIT